MFWVRSHPCEQQFPTEESSSGTATEGWDSWGMPESLTCAVTQTISSISSNPQGYHFSCPFLLDCFRHHKSRCLGFVREEAVTLKGCSALQNNIQLGSGPEELQHFRDSLGPCIQCTKK